MLLEFDQQVAGLGGTAADIDKIFEASRCHPATMNSQLVGNYPISPEPAAIMQCSQRENPSSMTCKMKLGGTTDSSRGMSVPGLSSITFKSLLINLILFTAFPALHRRFSRRFKDPAPVHITGNLRTSATVMY